MVQQSAESDNRFLDLISQSWRAIDEAVINTITPFARASRVT